MSKAEWVVLRFFCGMLSCGWIGYIYDGRRGAVAGLLVAFAINQLTINRGEKP